MVPNVGHPTPEPPSAAPVNPLSFHSRMPRTPTNTSPILPTATARSRRRSLAALALAAAVAFTPALFAQNQRRGAVIRQGANNANLTMLRPDQPAEMLPYADTAAFGIARRMLAGFNQAEPDTPTGRQTRNGIAERLLTSLAANDFAARRAVRNAFAASEVSSSDMLFMLSRDASPAARDALLDAAYERFIREDRAGVGMRPAQLAGRRLVVGETLPGFPAHEQQQLLPGDRIISIDGHALEGGDITKLRPVIFSFDEGDDVDFTIERPTPPPNAERERADRVDARGGAAIPNRLDERDEWWAQPGVPLERMTVRVTLGAAAALNGWIRESELREAWALRLDRLDIDPDWRTLTPSFDERDPLEHRNSRRRPFVDRFEALQTDADGSDELASDKRDPTRAANANSPFSPGAPDQFTVGLTTLTWTSPDGRTVTDSRLGRGLAATLHDRARAADLARHATRPEPQQARPARQVAMQIADSARERLRDSRRSLLLALEAIESIAATRRAVADDERAAAFDADARDSVRLRDDRADIRVE